MSETGVPIPGWSRAALARVFAWAGARRANGRALHPRGITRAGVARLSERGSSLSSGSADASQVVVRFSRGAGFPSAVPDVNGIAIRFVDAFGDGRHHDLLLASAGPGALRRVLLPAVDFARSRFSSISRYRLDGEPVIFLAAVGGRGLTLDRLGEVERPVELRLSAAAGVRAAPVELATMYLDRRADEAIRFDPTNAAPNITPMGWLNAIRPPAYPASRGDRSGRGAHVAT
jgi:hypothetical protein